jgi:hypothetical protein
MNSKHIKELTHSSSESPLSQKNYIISATSTKLAYSKMKWKTKI